jgi:HD-GYP domain-containing protein (c-di-GMP phosphodiesterase class II)
MTEQKENKLYAFYRDLCVTFIGSLRALSLYEKDHPEAKKKINAFIAKVGKYLKQKNTLTFLVIGGEIVVENTPLHELKKTLGQFIKRLEDMKLQNIVFRRGLTSDETVAFLEVLVPLIKKPDDADMVIAKNQKHFPHILAGGLPSEGGPKVSNEELTSALQPARESVVAITDQIKDLLSHANGPLSKAEVSTAKEITDSIQRKVDFGEIPLKMLIFRRSTDPDLQIHALNVCALSMALAKNMGIKDDFVLDVGFAALLHDLGLHLTFTNSFSKSAASALDDKKRQWEHPIRGAEVLFATPDVPDIAPLVAYEHHIRYGGGGYPKQTSPRDLNLASIITCITDTYDNLRRHHPNRASLSLTDTLNWIDKKSGTFFHPIVHKHFRNMIKAQAEEET